MVDLMKRGCIAKRLVISTAVISVVLTILYRRLIQTSLPFKLMITLCYFHIPKLLILPESNVELNHEETIIIFIYIIL